MSFWALFLTFLFSCLFLTVHFYLIFLHCFIEMLQVALCIESESWSCVFRILQDVSGVYLYRQISIQQQFLVQYFFFSQKSVVIANFLICIKILNDRYEIWFLLLISKFFFVNWWIDTELNLKILFSKLHRYNFQVAKERDVWCQRII